MAKVRCRLAMRSAMVETRRDLKHAELPMNISGRALALSALVAAVSALAGYFGAAYNFVEGLLPKTEWVNAEMEPCVKVCPKRGLQAVHLGVIANEVYLCIGHESGDRGFRGGHQAKEDKTCGLNSSNQNPSKDYRCLCTNKSELQL